MPKVAAVGVSPPGQILPGGVIAAQSVGTVPGIVRFWLDIINEISGSCSQVPVAGVCLVLFSLLV